MKPGFKSLSKKLEPACGGQRDAGPHGTAKIPRRRPFPIFHADSKTLLQNAVTIIVLAFFCLAGVNVQGQVLAPTVLTNAAQVRQLTPEEAGQHFPVRLRGVCTDCHGQSDSHLGRRDFSDGQAGVV
jgi:hypothetical protein